MILTKIVAMMKLRPKAQALAPSHQTQTQSKASSLNRVILDRKKAG
jgi:hypothetical protein